MAKKDYKKMAEAILSNAGGKDNITRSTHCLTRLRLNVIDKSEINEEALKSIPGVIGLQWTGEQLQLIIGQDVEDLYHAFISAGGFKAEEAIDELLDSDLQKQPFSVKGMFNEMVAAITGSITPILIIFTIGGFFRLFATIFGPGILGLLAEASDLLRLLSIVADSCFSFLPIYVAYSAAKRFNASIPLALLLAVIMTSGSLAEAMEAERRFTVYGIPVIPTTYTASFVPTLLVTYVLAKVEKFFKKLFPVVIRNILYPLCTMFVMLPLALCVLGPIGTVLGNFINSAISWLNNVLGPVATGLVGALFPILILTGMHHALNTAAYVEYIAKGFDSCVWAGSYIMDYQLMSLCFAQLIKAKKPEDKATALSCIATEGFGGISEPTLYGVILKSKRNIAYILIGGFVAGFYIGLTKTKMYVFAPGGFLSVLAYSGGSTGNFINGAIACVLSFVIPFVLALIFGMEDKAAAE